MAIVFAQVHRLEQKVLEFSNLIGNDQSASAQNALIYAIKWIDNAGHDLMRIVITNAGENNITQNRNTLSTIGFDELRLQRIVLDDYLQKAYSELVQLTVTSGKNMELVGLLSKIEYPYCQYKYKKKRSDYIRQYYPSIDTYIDNQTELELQAQADSKNLFRRMLARKTTRKDISIELITQIKLVVELQSILLAISSLFNIVEKIQEDSQTESATDEMELSSKQVQTAQVDSKHLEIKAEEQESMAEDVIQ